VRDTFVKFFMEKKGHKNVVSSPVVPHDDPTLLFTNAGMNQFKAIFLGKADPKSPLYSLTRACNSQKCIRAGGKHNDLDDVGKDTYHHTFFEMLGNWSFGDYFKKEAIHWAWELLTEVYGLNPEYLYATYFGGDPDQPSLAVDEEAKAIWLTILPPERVLPFGCADNFWEMGDVGPCGPCTEIHYDRLGATRGKNKAASMVNMDDPMVLEIWNNVFIQFNREADKSLKSLPNKHVDTGMGFERLTSILQDKLSNYDTDVFTPIFNEIQKVTGAPAYQGMLGDKDKDGRDMAYRVVADHIRTLSFAIADGAQPGSDGRNYVLRRILRRAVRYGKEKLGAKPGFFNQLVWVVAATMGDVFPEVRAQAPLIQSVLLEEEESFTKTLTKGIERFQKFVAQSDGKCISGDNAFLLWDTYGFPVDLTELMAEEQGFEVDKEGFTIAMEKQKAMSRAARSGGGSACIVLEAEATAHLAKLGIQPTDDAPKYTQAVLSTRLAAIMSLEGFHQSTKELAAGSVVGLVLDATSFYAEQGGQIYDTGKLISAGGTSLLVDGVKVAAGYVLHTGEIGAGGSFTVGDKISAEVDYVRRQLIAPNHTCTHILNLALMEVLGDGIHQKGSLVDPEKLRFDFSHGKQVLPAELAKVEARVQEIVQANLLVSAKEVSLEQAKQITGLRAVFGEVYPDPVRVVSVGSLVEDLLADPKNSKWAAQSTEFCGGTHLSSTGEAQCFVLLQEEGIAKGVRRITGLTRSSALEAVRAADELAVQLAGAKKLTGAALEQEVSAIKQVLDSATLPTVRKHALKEDLSALQKILLEASKAVASQSKATIISAAKSAAESAASAGEKFCVVCVDVLDSAAVREAVMAVLKIGKVGIALFAVDADKDKMMLYTGVPPDVTGVDCVAWMKAGVEAIGGKGGGGKGGMAQGQGSGVAKLETCREAAIAFAKKSLS